MIARAIGRLMVDGTLNASLDPRAVDELGATIGEVLEALGIEAIVCWVGGDEAALSQVVGSRLGVRVIRAQESLGLLTLDLPPSEALRVALIATQWSGYRPLASLVGLVTNEGLKPVIAVSVVGGQEESYDGIPVSVLENM